MNDSFLVAHLPSNNLSEITSLFIWLVFVSYWLCLNDCLSVLLSLTVFSLARVSVYATTTRSCQSVPQVVLFSLHTQALHRIYTVMTDNTANVIT